VDEFPRRSVTPVVVNVSVITEQLTCVGAGVSTDIAILSALAVNAIGKVTTASDALFAGNVTSATTPHCSMIPLGRIWNPLNVAE